MDHRASRQTGNHRQRRVRTAPVARRRSSGPRIATTVLLAAAGLGVAVTSGLTLASLSGASSGSGGNVVVFGDSYYSSPDPAALTRPCARSDGNWARLAAADTGADIHDFSCGGATSESMLDLVDEALASGDLGSETGTVFLSIGGNDFGHQGAVRGAKIDDLDGRRTTVLDNIGVAVTRIRAAAPYARLVFSSYLPATVGPYVCRDAGPVDGVSLPVYDQQLDETEAYISETMAIAAEEHDATFVDVRAAADGNSTCSPVGQRYLSGEDGAADVLMAWHPTAAGDRFMADLFIPQITR
ncbi:GDSL-type esterase/lipase family protein [uncultured Corynebacterium sp.]|uniref:GDSL-type esterase/lipase family protein n=1 Tax=uncultured Corynebacterium sp. TaxID=159447 RepID=UPI0025E170E9|nr:GDSL-type esterase/lipase family protein [uncultured Corynebacterium sp.]